MNDAERFVRDEPELTEKYAGNLPSFDFASLDLEERIYRLRQQYRHEWWVAVIAWLLARLDHLFRWR